MKQVKTNMIAELTDFNSLLKRNESAAIVVIDDRYEWIVEPKETAEQFMKGIENAVNDRYDGSCEIRTAETFDSGYSMEIVVKINIGDGNNFPETIYLYHANAF